MTKKSAKRMLQRAEDVRNKKVMYALETMGAAYCKMTDISPTEAVLRVKSDEKTQELLYWFENHGPRINDQTAHGDVLAMLDLSKAIVTARRTQDAALLEEALGALEVFVKRYEE